MERAKPAIIFGIQGIRLMAAIKRTPADKAFSDCVRSASEWTCERCHTYYEEGRRMGLHCSHFTEEESGVLGFALKTLRRFVTGVILILDHSLTFTLNIN